MHSSPLKPADFLVRDLKAGTERRAAAELAAAAHARSRAELPFLPPRGPDYFLPKLEWMADNGQLVGLYAADGPGGEGELLGYWAAFFIDDFRNAGKGAFSPEWAHALVPALAAPEARGAAHAAFAACYRALSPRWLAAGARLHALAFYASEASLLEAAGLTGFGRIVMDAAVPTDTLAAALAVEAADSAEAAADAPGLAVDRAFPADAADLAYLNDRLAEHIGAAPVLVPDARGPDADDWAEWFRREEAIAFIARDGEGRPVGFIKAETPQFDVSYSVHDPATLAINGLFVLVERRGAGAAARLLARLAAHAAERGKTLVSVDCETTNPEAYAFWTRRFRPVAWSLERRV
jgi:GNAT superfamily N-acetyltransferase